VQILMISPVRSTRVTDSRYPMMRAKCEVYL